MRPQSVTGVCGASAAASGDQSETSEHSSTGHPLLANDPHLGAALPSVWYQVQLKCATVDEDCPFDVGAAALQVGGGVAANSRLRAMVAERGAEAGIEVRIPRRALCTDNGAMVAALGAQMAAKGRAPSTLDLPADSSMPVTDVQSGLPVDVDHDHPH